MILTQTAICSALPSLTGIIEVNLFSMFVQFGVFLLEFSDKMELALFFFFFSFRVTWLKTAPKAVNDLLWNNIWYRVVDSHSAFRLNLILFFVVVVVAMVFTPLP